MNFFMLVVKQLSKIYPSAKRWAYRFHGGVFPRYNKSLSASQPIRPQLIPEKLILPLQQQVGLPACPIVQVGDKVKKNQLLAKPSKDPQKALSVPIHAPTSGTIIAIEEATLAHPSGLEGVCIILQPDGANQAIENALEVDGSLPKTPVELKSVLLKSGIVGMGGAGFPTYAKLPNERGRIHTLLINGAECEPFITCDDLLMQTQAEAIIKGALLTAEALGAERIICGIETNKPAAIQAMKKAAASTSVEIKEVATVYPMGGQKQLTLELTGIETPHDSHAVDIGLLMMNVATLTAIYRAVSLGDPLTSRLVTVSGLGLEKPFNMDVMIGTPFNSLAQAAKPKVKLDYPLVMGGPMMGFQVKSNEVPVLKTTNCVLANPPEPVDMQMPCIRCGECMDVCPVNLLPQQMYWYSQAHEFDKVEKLQVFDCIECGCCSYVCPSHIPLVQYYRHAKSEIKAIHAEEKAVELAKQRHEFKLARIEREKQEREARLKAKKEAVKQAAAKTEDSSEKSPAKKAAGAAAAARAAAAKRAMQKGNKPSSGSDKAMPSARLKAIEAAKKAAQNSELEAGSTASKKSSTGDAKSKARQAAQKAAQKRAQKAKAQSEPANKDAKTNLKSESSSPTKEPSAEAMSLDLTQTSEATTASQKEAARKAAMQAARAAAKKRKASSSDHQVSSDKPSGERSDNQTHQQDENSDKRQKAMEAARKRAKQRQAEKNQAADNQENT